MEDSLTNSTVPLASTTKIKPVIDSATSWPSNGSGTDKDFNKLTASFRLRSASLKFLFKDYTVVRFHENCSHGTDFDFFSSIYIRPNIHSLVCKALNLNIDHCIHKETLGRVFSHYKYL